MTGTIDTSRIEGRLFQSVAQHPDRNAFACREDSLSYRELADNAGRLACQLAKNSLGAGDRVGIFMFKSIEMPVAVFGVLSSGCVYVPLDPLTRPARLRQIVEDCNIRCLICDRHTSKVARALAGELGLLLIGEVSDDDSTNDNTVRLLSWAKVLETPTQPDFKAESPSDNAYIIYTSGTTGQPKGILHTHESALAYVDACMDTWDFSADDHFANHSPLHFDMATMEFLVAPAVGARVTLVPEDLMKMPASVAQLLELEQISVWYSVPFALIQLLDSHVLEARALENLRLIISAGEAFPLPKLKALYVQLPEIEFSNAYGPTETNVCTVYKPDRHTLDQIDALPIGVAWRSSITRVENEHGDVTSTGEVGELLVAGGTVMAGYWQRPDLNRNCFVRPEDSTDTFYRTGDLVHRDDDGVLHLHGRKDRQIKLRGFRIELDEIENLLYENPAVTSAAVLKHPREDKLIAAVALSNDDTTVEKALRKLLRDRLPAHAVPAEIITLETMPLSANSKIDRAALVKIAGDHRREDIRAQHVPN